MDTLQLDPNKRYTYADYLTWNGDDRYELLRGFVSLMSAPWRLHQEISMALSTTVSNIIRPKRSCKVYHAPFDVRLPKTADETADDRIYTVVQPDLVVVCDKSKLDERGCIGAPELVAEIVSPSSLRKDLNDKRKLYEEHGVLEYWLIYPKEGVIHQYTLDDSGTYGDPNPYTVNDVMPSKVIEGLEIDLKELFEDN